MGRHSSDESEHSRGGRRKRRSRSASYDRSESRERKSRKKSRKHPSPSRSKRHRSRSSSYEKSHRSRSGSRRKTRRSHSRSTETSRHSSVSRSSKHKGSRRSRSGSRSYSRSKHDSGLKSSKSRRKSRSRSRGRSHSSNSNDSTSMSSRKPTTLKSQPSSASLDYLTSAEKAEAMLQMALKAAAAADEQLKSQGLLAAGVGRPLISTEDQQKRANAIEEIDSEGFLQSAFRSTRSEIPLPKGSKADASHAGAMFGTSSSSTFLDSIKTSDSTLKASAVEDDNLLMHPNMYLMSAEEKMEKWKVKIVEIRKKILKETGGVIP